MVRRAAPIAIACALAAAAAAPVAAERGGVVVIATAAAPATVDDTARAVARGLTAIGAAADPATAAAAIDALAAARAARARGAVPAGRLRGFARAAQLAAEGWRAYLAVDGEFAAARLAAARAEAEDLLALDGGRELYADVALRLGLVLTALGRTGDGGEVVRLAHALDPARAPSASEFSPDAVAAFQAAIAATPPQRPVELIAPTGAAIAIDGIDVGRAPVAVGLAVGQHVVVVRAPGWLPRGQAVSIAAAAAGEPPVRLELALDPDPGAVLDDPAALAVGASPARAGAAVDQVLLAAELDALYLVASVHHGGRPALLGQRCVAARPACSEVIEVDYADGAGLDGAARLLLDRLVAARRRGGVGLPIDDRLRGGRGPGPGDGGRRRWIVAGVGVAALAAIVTAAVLAGDDQPTPIVTIDPGDFGL